MVNLQQTLQDVSEALQRKIEQLLPSGEEEDNGSTVIALCERLRLFRPGLPFVVLTDLPLGEEEEMAVRGCTDALLYVF